MSEGMDKVIEYLRSKEGTVRDVASGAMAGALGAPVDLMSMLLRAGGYKTPAKDVAGSSEWFGDKLTGADTDSMAFLGGQFLSPAMYAAGLRKMQNVPTAVKMLSGGVDSDLQYPGRREAMNKLGKAAAAAGALSVPGSKLLSHLADDAAPVVDDVVAPVAAKAARSWGGFPTLRRIFLNDLADNGVDIDDAIAKIENTEISDELAERYQKLEEELAAFRDEEPELFKEIEYPIGEWNAADDSIPPEKMAKLNHLQDKVESFVEHLMESVDWETPEAGTFSTVEVPDNELESSFSEGFKSLMKKVDPETGAVAAGAAGAGAKLLPSAIKKLGKMGILVNPDASMLKRYISSIAEDGGTPGFRTIKDGAGNEYFYPAEADIHENVASKLNLGRDWSGGFLSHTGAKKRGTGYYDMDAEPLDGLTPAEKRWYLEED